MRGRPIKRTLQQVIERLALDPDLQGGHVGEIRLPQGARLIPLLEEHLLRAPRQRAPALDASLQRAELTVLKATAPRGHRVAPASLSRRIWSGSRRSAIVCRSSMIAGAAAGVASPQTASGPAAPALPPAWPVPRPTPPRTDPAVSASRAAAAPHWAACPVLPQLTVGVLSLTYLHARVWAVV